jgi:nicotinate-nucleotide pyrophosphorylase (carboxylating)
MIMKLQLEQEIAIIIKNALREDIGEGDHSSLACIPKDTRGKAKLLVKEDCVIAGIEFATKVFQEVDQTSIFKFYAKDGDSVKKGDVVFEVESASHSILKAERLVLNSMQRMSAIATKTKNFVKLLEGTSTQLLDTRKTTPGFRALEKLAVKIGGGVNHRFALYDMIMLKDNHIDFAGGISKAIQKTNQYLAKHQLDLKIIVEARSLNEVHEILQNKGVYRILLDNFSYEDTRKAVAMIDHQCLTESSGGIDESNAREYALCGVNYISSGALIHSVHNVDLSLKAM